MPDQHSAADEHALIQEITAPLSMLPDNPVPIAADVNFPVVLRGYDRLSVDAYVQKTSQLVAELHATRSPETAVRRALERVGDQVSSILQRAHETSGLITAQSRREAEDRVQAAREEATQITASAEQRVRDLDADTDRIWAERMRIVDDSRQLARELLALADAAAEQFPPAETGSSPALEGDRPDPGSIVDYSELGYGSENEADADLAGLEDEDRHGGLELDEEGPDGPERIAGGPAGGHHSDLETHGAAWPEPVGDLEGEVDPSATAAFAPVEDRDPGHAGPSQPPHDHLGDLGPSQPPHDHLGDLGPSQPPPDHLDELGPSQPPPDHPDQPGPSKPPPHRSDP